MTVRSKTAFVPLRRPVLLALLSLLALLGLVLLPAAPAGAQPRAAEEPDGYERLGPPVRLSDVAGGALLLATELDGVYLPAPGVRTDVTVRVVGLLARTEVRQRFHNPTSAWVEGVYVFPLPEGSAVDTLRMTVGDRVIEGEIHEREEAERIYREARAAGNRASLVEQERPNLFTTSVANLGPDEELVVTIEYQEELRYDAGVFSLRFPMVAAPRYVPGGVAEGVGSAGPLQTVGASHFGEYLDGRGGVPVDDAHRLASPVVPAAFPDGEPVNPVHLTVELDAGFPVDRMGSSSHVLDVARAGRAGGPGSSYPTYRVTLAGAPVPADRDFVLEWAPAVGREPEAALFTEEVDGETYALLMLMPPTPSEDQAVAQVAAEASPPREAIFVIDVSGSMSGESLEQAKAALAFAVDRLAPEDHLQIIKFSDDASALFPASVPAGDRALEEARAFVRSLETEGGTNMMPALDLALAGRPVPGAVRQVVFVTDGAVGNEAQLLQRIRSRLGASRLFTVGIGSAPNGHFMRRAAEEGRGGFTYIGRTEDVGPMMEGLYAKLESPVLTGLELDWGTAGAEAWPERLPDLYAGEPVMVAARLPAGSLGDGSEAVLSGRFGHRTLEMRKSLGTKRGEGGLAAVERPGVSRLWARRKIAALESSSLDGVPHDQVRSSIVEVALRHHLVTAFTSLVAVDRTPARPNRPDGEAMHSRRLPVSLPAGWQAPGPVGYLPQGGTGSRLLAVVGLALLTLAGAGVARERLRTRGARVAGRVS
jgi:Ca-activated chloride channel homolog